MTLRNIDRRIKKWIISKCKTTSFLVAKIFHLKKKSSYWKDFDPAIIKGYPTVGKVWEIVFIKLKPIKKIKYVDLKEFYFTCFCYYLYFYQNSYFNKQSKIEAINEHDKYINFLYDQEKKRQETMDSKAKQIITNASIVITIVGLFITVLASFFKGKVIIQNYYFYTLIISLLFLFFSLLISINVLNLKKYGRPYPEIVFDAENCNEETFLRKKIISFHSPIILNTSVNSKKSNRLILANNTYKWALILVTWLTIKSIYTLSQNNEFGLNSVENTTPQVNINLNLKNLDSIIKKTIVELKSESINKIRYTTIYRHDTINRNQKCCGSKTININQNIENQNIETQKFDVK